MTKQKTAAAPKKGVAASSENGHKEVTFRDLTFGLPEELPLSVSFDLAGVGGVFADLRFLGSVLGTDQIMALRTKLDQDGVKLDPDGTEVLGKLVEQVLSEYGFDVGESEASPKS
jgi:hypothetical protein